MADDNTELEQRFETWFLRRGIPHFIHDYSATRDVLTRALPLLVLVFLAEMVGAANEGWPLWANALSMAGGLAVLAGGWMAANELRSRPLTARPERVGPIEMAVFVIVPALLPLVFGGKVGEAAAIATGNAALLATIYVATSYGIVPMARWALVRIVSQLGATLGLFARALPLLLLVFMFLFINAEVWAVAGGIDSVIFAVTIGLLASVAGLFVLARVPAELRAASEFDSWPDVECHTAGSPAAGLRPRSAEPAHVPDPSAAEWANVGLVMVFSQALQVLVVAGLVVVFFVTFGVLTISADTILDWTGTPATVITTLDVGSREFLLTRDLLQVAGFLGAFAGLYFTVYAVHDPSFRADFFEEITGEVRESFAVRAIYRDSVAA